MFLQVAMQSQKFPALGSIRTMVGNAPEPQFPLHIHYACTIPTAQSAPDANLGSNGPELYHGKVSIRRSYSSSYIYTVTQKTGSHLAIFSL